MSSRLRANLQTCWVRTKTRRGSSVRQRFPDSVTLEPTACRAQLVLAVPAFGSRVHFASHTQFCAAQWMLKRVQHDGFGRVFLSLCLRVFVRTFKLVKFAQRHEEAVQCDSGSQTLSPWSQRRAEHNSFWRCQPSAPGSILPLILSSVLHNGC
jgi:hypothetical protein